MTLPAAGFFTNASTQNGPAKQAQDDMLAVLKALNDSGNLTAIAALTFAADKILYATGPGAFSLANLTSVARTLLACGNSATMRQALGLIIGSDVQAYDAATAKLNAVNAYTRQQYAVPVTVAPVAGAVTLDAELHQEAEITSTVALTMNAPTKSVKGMRLFMRLYAASALGITWNAAFKPNVDVALPTAHVAGKGMYLDFRHNGASWVLMGKVVEA